MTKTALVLGAGGGVGGETAHALVRHGWKVRGFARSPREGDGIDWYLGDAMKRRDVETAAEGVDVIVHAVNPPGYRNWAALVLPMIENSIAAAEANGARLALPGTIYNYDPRETPVARPDSPQNPGTHKGAIRAELEHRMETANIRSLILRCGDFFGPYTGNNWLAQGMIKPGQPVTSITTPGRKGIGHAWAYLPDVGEAFARLLDVEEALPRFARYHFGGYWDADGIGFAAAIARAAGRPELKPMGLPWMLLPLAAPFNATLRELIEMKPFWRHPIRLENRELIEAIGDEPHTPLDKALADTLRALECWTI
ncbi:MAG: NAD(P)H-binding protein [Sphingomonadales bacterium]|nr:NAD(P)H-binding protein [Sphingomonadales bacterium]